MIVFENFLLKNKSKINYIEIKSGMKWNAVQARFAPRAHLSMSRSEA